MVTKYSNPEWKRFSQCVRDGRLDQAQVLLENLRKDYPDNHKIWRWMLKLAKTEAKRIECLRKLVQIAPQEPTYRHKFVKHLFNRGVRLAKGDDHQQARLDFKEASDLHPHSEKIWYWLAFVAKNNQDRASYLTKVLTINPNHSQAREWMAKHLAKQQDPDTSWQCPICQETYQETQSECGQCGVVLDLNDISYILSDRKVDVNLVHMGITNLNHRALNGHRFQNKMNIGIAYLNLHQWEKALEVFLDIQPIQPDLELLNSAIRHLQEKAKEKEEAFKPPARSRGTVMVVDDSATVRKLVTITVEDMGFDVLEASNGSQALSKIFEKKPDCIFLDIKMPQMDGYQVCKILKENEHTQDIPIIMLTGQDGFIDRVRGKMAGALDYITKPFDAETLAGALERHLSKRVHHGS